MDLKLAEQQEFLDWIPFSEFRSMASFGLEMCQNSVEASLVFH
jgi:hypothetical protein